MPAHLSYSEPKVGSIAPFGHHRKKRPIKLEKFKTICNRIGLNIPAAKRWAWDETYNHALVVFDKDDLELVLLPVALEFEQKWDFNTIEGSSRLINDFLQSGFGLMPGQNFFVAADDQARELLLYATCWPWGDGDNFSLRVGLFSENPEYPTPDQIKSLLTDWFGIEKP
jgi:hypothetical protein